MTLDSIDRYLPEESIHPGRRVERAILIATLAHLGQVDQDGQPHIAHCLRVWDRVKTYTTCTWEDEVGAILHDTVEDTDLTLDDIQTHFGPVVAEIVDGVTRREGEFYRTAFIPRAAASRGGLVKLADVTDNLRRSQSSKMRGLAKRYEQALAILREHGFVT
jgi:(p)ppGpp synthase/HD superfamily hydrolase